MIPTAFLYFVVNSTFPWFPSVQYSAGNVAPATKKFVLPLTLSDFVTFPPHLVINNFTSSRSNPKSAVKANFLSLIRSNDDISSHYLQDRVANGVPQGLSKG